MRSDPRIVSPQQPILKLVLRARSIRRWKCLALADLSISYRFIGYNLLRCSIRLRQFVRRALYLVVLFLPMSMSAGRPDEGLLHHILGGLLGRHFLSAMRLIAVVGDRSRFAGMRPLI